MYFEIEKQAIDAINKALDQYDVDIDRNFKLEFPPNPDLGDLASTIAFALTKKLRTSPPEVAKDLVEKIEVPEIFSKVQNFGPYVNFFIDYSKFSKLLLEKVDENYGQLPAYGEKIVLEHTSANPNGPLHIGHIRNSIFGDSLSRLLKLAGRDVVTQYYVNDMGRQIAIIVCGITECGLKIEDYEGEKIDHKIGKLYFDANKAVEEDEALNAKVDELIQKYEEGSDEELNKVFEDVVSKCISGMKESLLRMNIVHDDFVWEGQFVRSGEVDDLVDYIQKEGFASQEDVMFIDLTEFNIEKEFVLRRSNGTSLYSTRDLAYHKYKATLGDTVLDILGSDHKLAAKQIKVIFEEIFRQLDADFFCLQETKMQAGQLDLQFAGYHSYWNYAEKKGYSGTAIFCKQTPLHVTYGINKEEHDHEGRVITLEMEQFYLVTVYTPNSQDGLKRLDYRMDWEDDFRDYLMSLDKHKPVVECGDLNVAHQEIDLKNPKTNRKNAGFTDEERACFTKVLESGFIDTFRYFYPDQTDIYSWWSYRFSARAKNAGWRIDYFCVSECLKDKLQDAKIHTDILGSDHCPVELDIAL